MYLTFDIGTSSVKGALIDEDGRLVADARSPVELYRGDGEAAWEAEPAEWLRALAECAAPLCGSGDREIRALAISGNGPTLVPVDSTGLPVGRALSWMDRRATSQADRISELLGFPLDPYFYLPKALWFMENRPKEFARTSRFFSCPEWIAFRLCGTACSYLADPYYEQYVWATDAAVRLGLDASLFPPYIKPGESLGTVLPSASDEFHIPVGTPVMAGFPDFLASVLGSGAVVPGMACDRAGTSEAYNLCAEKPCPDRTFLSLPHAVPGLWNISGGLSTSGKALDWYSKISGLDADGRTGTKSLFKEARSSVPGARGLLFLPFLAGERAPLWKRDIRGAFLGLSVDHGRQDLARAVSESIGLGLRLTSSGLFDHGYPTSLIRVSGAPARNDFLNRLKADILGLPVEVPELADCELTGNAAACAVGLGDHGSLKDAATALSRISRRFEPDLAVLPMYDRLFGVLSDAVKSLASISERLVLCSTERGGRRPE